MQIRNLEDPVAVANTLHAEGLGITPAEFHSDLRSDMETDTRVQMPERPPALALDLSADIGQGNLRVDAHRTDAAAEVRNDQLADGNIRIAGDRQAVSLGVALHILDIAGCIAECLLEAK